MKPALNQKSTGIRTREAIVAFIASEKTPPTLAEIASAAGIKKGSVQYHLTFLWRAGLATWRSGKNRSVRLTKRGLETVGAS